MPEPVGPTTAMTGRLAPPVSGVRTGSDGMPSDTPVPAGTAAPGAGAPQESAWDLSQASPARERRRL